MHRPFDTPYGLLRARSGWGTNAKCPGRNPGQCVWPGRPEFNGLRPLPNRAHHWIAMERISKLFEPFGVVTSTESPTRLPIRARAIGEEVEMKPREMSAS